MLIIIFIFLETKRAWVFHFMIYSSSSIQDALNLFTKDHWLLTIYTAMVIYFFYDLPLLSFLLPFFRF